MTDYRTADADTITLALGARGMASPWKVQLARARLAANGRLEEAMQRIAADIAAENDTTGDAA